MSGPERQDDMFGVHAERGQENRDGAQAALEDRYAGFLLAMREEARKVCERIGRVSTDDLRTIARIKGIAEVDPHIWGAIFKELDADNRPTWKCVGNTPSVIPANNGRLIRLWRLAR